MPAYRVEVSPNNRAGCQDAFCKSNGDKIMKGDIRFGVWVEGTSGSGHEFQSFRWRHWGCVSGKTIQNLRENLTGSLADAGEYNWDLFDGLEEMPSEHQKKIKLAITKGKIADEDWKGDPAYNVLGKTGIRGRASSKKQELEEVKEGVENTAEVKTPVNPAAKKHGRAKGPDEDEEAKPLKRRATKAKKEDYEESDFKLARKAAKNKEEENALKPGNGSRAKKAVKKVEKNASAGSAGEEVGTQKKLATHGRFEKGSKKKEVGARGVKSEGINEALIDVKPAKKSRGKRAAEPEPLSDSDVKKESKENFNINNNVIGDARTEEVMTEERPGIRSLVMKDEEDLEEWKLITKHENKNSPTGIKGEGFYDKGKAGLFSSNVDDNYKAEMPEDPLEQIASAFCDRDGPLVSEFNEMVEGQEVASDDWDEFLQKKFRAMVNSGDAADGDFNGFLQKMNERESTFREPPPMAPKKGRKRKKAPETAVKSRAQQHNVA